MPPVRGRCVVGTCPLDSASSATSPPPARPADRRPLGSAPARRPSTACVELSASVSTTSRSSASSLVFVVGGGRAHRKHCPSPRYVGTRRRLVGRRVTCTVREASHSRLSPPPPPGVRMYIAIADASCRWNAEQRRLHLPRTPGVRRSRAGVWAQARCVAGPDARYRRRGCSPRRRRASRTTGIREHRCRAWRERSVGVDSVGPRMPRPAVTSLRRPVARALELPEPPPLTSSSGGRPAGREHVMPSSPTARRARAGRDPRTALHSPPGSRTAAQLRGRWAGDRLRAAICASYIHHAYQASGSPRGERSRARARLRPRGCGAGERLTPIRTRRRAPANRVDVDAPHLALAA